MGISDSRYGRFHGARIDAAGAARRRLIAGATKYTRMRINALLPRIAGEARESASDVAGGMAPKGLALKEAPIIDLHGTLVLFRVLSFIAILQTLPCAPKPAFEVVVSERIRIRKLREELVAVVRRLLAVVGTTGFLAAAVIVRAVVGPVEAERINTIDRVAPGIREQV
jgi:hypothetical protein